MVCFWRVTEAQNAGSRKQARHCQVGRREGGGSRQEAHAEEALEGAVHGLESKLLVERLRLDVSHRWHIFVRDSPHVPLTTICYKT